MAMTGRTKKRSAKGGSGSPARTKGGMKSVLDKMDPDELATVLRTLLAKHPELRTEADSIGVDMVSAPSVEDVAEDVFDAVTSLDTGAFHGRAGKQPWGYVEPTEAAWELLDEAVVDVMADMKRRAELGLHQAAEKICCGVVLGLHKATATESDGPLRWAPDFPAEEACHAVAELLRMLPAKNRQATRDRLVETLSVLVPGWHEMISRAADRPTKKR